MIRLEHINLVVKDLDRSLNFYKAAMPHWRIRDSGESDWYGTKRRWLHFGDDYNYLSINNNGTGEIRDLETNRLGLSHIGFVVSDIDSVIKRLTDAGFEVSKPGSNCQYRKNVYFIDADGFEIEFVEYLSDIPEHRNLSD